VLGAIDHVALIVRDPARTAALFKELFQADTADMESDLPERPEQARSAG
jgi:hypothetical protein